MSSRVVRSASHRRGSKVLRGITLRCVVRIDGVVGLPVGCGDFTVIVERGKKVSERRPLNPAALNRGAVRKLIAKPPTAQLLPTLALSLRPTVSFICELPKKQEYAFETKVLHVRVVDERNGQEIIGTEMNISSFVDENNIIQQQQFEIHKSSLQTPESSSIIGTTVAGNAAEYRLVFSVSGRECREEDEALDEELAAADLPEAAAVPSAAPRSEAEEGDAAANAENDTRSPLRPPASTAGSHIVLPPTGWQFGLLSKRQRLLDDEQGSRFCMEVAAEKHMNSVNEWSKSRIHSMILRRQRCDLCEDEQWLSAIIAAEAEDELLVIRQFIKTVCVVGDEEVARSRVNADECDARALLRSSSTFAAKRESSDHQYRPTQCLSILSVQPPAAPSSPTGQTKAVLIPLGNASTASSDEEEGLPAFGINMNFTLGDQLPSEVDSNESDSDKVTPISSDGSGPHDPPRYRLSLGAVEVDSDTSRTPSPHLQSTEPNHRHLFRSSNVSPMGTPTTDHVRSQRRGGAGITWIMDDASIRDDGRVEREAKSPNEGGSLPLRSGGCDTKVSTQTRREGRAGTPLHSHVPQVADSSIRTAAQKSPTLAPKAVKPNRSQSFSAITTAGAIQRTLPSQTEGLPSPSSIRLARRQSLQAPSEGSRKAAIWISHMVSLMVEDAMRKDTKERLEQRAATRAAERILAANFQRRMQLHTAFLWLQPRLLTVEHAEHLGRRDIVSARALEFESILKDVKRSAAAPTLRFPANGNATMRRFSDLGGVSTKQHIHSTRLGRVSSSRWLADPDNLATALDPQTARAHYQQQSDVSVSKTPLPPQSISHLRARKVSILAPTAEGVSSN